MKKIIYTLLTAVLALSFMGCPTTYDDVKYDEFVPTVQYIMGDIAVTPAAMEVNGRVATYTFTYEDTMTAWGGSNGAINFKVAANATAAALDWDNAWSDAKLTINGEAVFTESRNGGNNTCEGLTAGEEYTITVTSGVGGVSFAITGAAAAPIAPAKPSLLKTITGNAFNWAPLTTVVETENVNVYTYEFAYNGAADSWDNSAENQVSFKVSVASTEDWTAENWGGVDVTSDGTVVALTKNPGMANGKIKGLTAGTTYIVTFLATSEGVSASCKAK